MSNDNTIETYYQPIPTIIQVPTFNNTISSLKSNNLYLDVGSMIKFEVG